jgi:asparagine synthase (glutamine-hydrolysing)
MCGIVGIYSKNNSLHENIDEAVIKLQHRGPDSQHSERVGENLSLGHTRLSIVDLNERSNQPMHDKLSGNVIVFNGEIFNHKELRKLLPEREFSTTSDTEVLLYLLSDFGPSILSKCNGMFAFAFWEADQQVLHLGRDRFGQKPLFYYCKGDTLAFASEAKALEPLIGRFSINHEQVLNYLFEITIGKNEQSFFSDILQVKNGCVMSFKMKKEIEVDSQRFWHYPKKKLSLSYEEAVTEMRELLQDSISLRIPKEVPFAAMLSGGMDSSSICSFAALSHPDKKITSISAIYPGDVKDESSYARMVTTMYPNISPIWIDNIDSRRSQSVIKDVIYHLESPLADGSLVAQHILMKEIGKRGIKVILSGNGGDEVLAGYPDIFRPAREIEDLKKFSFHLSTRAFFHLLPIKFKNYLYKKKHKSLGILKDQSKLQLLWDRFYDHEADDLLNNYLINGIEHWTLPNLMWYEDRNSMAASLESRSPFLDYRLVEFLLQLPASFKIDQHQTKNILRDAACGIVPDGILNRKDKQGFHAPNDQWVKSIDKAFLDDPAFREAFPYLDMEVIANSNFRTYWRTYSLYLWFQEFINNDKY